ncbi:MAG: hypothetical protein ABI988_02805 [Nitrospirota bacterium]
MKQRNMKKRNTKKSATNTMEIDPETWNDSIVASGKGVLTTIEDGMGAIGRGTWNFFHHLPGHGTLAGGAVGLGAAMLVGVGELAVGCFTAYVSYRMFAYGESLAEAVENTIQFEAGTLDEKKRNKPVLE